MLTPAVPAGISACLSDLDGVLTQTAKVHAAAWKRMFDAFLLYRAHQSDEGFRPFELPADYAAHVDGRLHLVLELIRRDGVDVYESPVRFRGGGPQRRTGAHGRVGQQELPGGDLGELLEER